MGNSFKIYTPYHLRAKKGTYSALLWALFSGALFFLLGLAVGYMGYLDKALLPLSKQLNIEAFKVRSLSLSEQLDQEGLLMQVKQLEQDNSALQRANTGFEQQITKLTTIPEEQGEEQLRARVRQLQVESMGLKQAKAEAEKQLHMLQSTSQVSQVAVKGSQETLRKMQEELADLKGELGIYQRLSSAANQNGNLGIQTFKIIKNSSKLIFQLVLTKGVGKNAVIKGTAYISVQGNLKGKKRILNLSEISPSSTNDLTFQFRFFQVLSSEIQWPKGFQPETVFVRAIPETAGSEEISQRWDWAELLAKADKQ